MILFFILPGIHRYPQALGHGGERVGGEGAAPVCREVEPRCESGVAEGLGSPRSVPERERPGTGLALSPRFSIQILAVSSGRGRWGVRLPPGRPGLPSRVQGPKGPSGLLPSSPGSLPWHEAGTRPGWASGAGPGVLLPVLSSGAGVRGVPWARAPRPLVAHAPGAQRRLTAAPGPAAPQTGSGRLA